MNEDEFQKKHFPAYEDKFLNIMKYFFWFAGIFLVFTSSLLLECWLYRDVPRFCP